MKFHQNIYLSGAWGKPIEGMDNANLVLLFGNRSLVKDEAIMAEVRTHYPKADIVGCSTAGEIQDTNI